MRIGLRSMIRQTAKVTSTVRIRITAAGITTGTIECKYKINRIKMTATNNAQEMPAIFSGNLLRTPIGLLLFSIKMPLFVPSCLYLNLIKERLIAKYIFSFTVFLQKRHKGRCCRTGYRCRALWKWFCHITARPAVNFC